MVVSLLTGTPGKKSNMQPAACKFYHGVLILIGFGDVFHALIIKTLPILIILEFALRVHRAIVYAHEIIQVV